MDESGGSDGFEILDKVSLILVVLGGLNWGLEGLGYFIEDNLNIFSLVFKEFLGMPGLESGVYLLIGLAGLYQVYFGYELYEKQG